MNKKIAVIILLLTIISITVAIKLSPNVENTEYNASDGTQENIYNSQSYLEFKKYITSTNDLEQDTNYYINQVRVDIRKIFDILNQETDDLLNNIFDNKKINIDEKLNIIKIEEEKLLVTIDNAIHNFKSNDYINAFNALKKYISLQNKLIYEIADIYKTEKNIAYDRYTGLLHNTHQDMSQEEIDYINFLSSVDVYADEEK